MDNEKVEKKETKQGEQQEESKRERVGEYVVMYFVNSATLMVHDKRHLEPVFSGSPRCTSQPTH